MKSSNNKTAGFFTCSAVLFLLWSIGCSSSDTVGLRIFNPSPRFYDDKVYFDLIDPADNSRVVVNLVATGDWWPAEIHRLQKSVPLILRVRYEGAAISDPFRKDLVAEYRVDMRQDYDITVRWTPFMERPSIDDEENEDFDWAPHWARQPEFELTPGHPPVF